MNLLLIAGPMGVDRNKVTAEAVKHLKDISKQKVAVLRNDVSGGVFDTSLAEECGVSLQNLRGGCVSCSLKSDFIESLRSIVRDEDPDVVVFETNPNAKPSVIKDAVIGTCGFDVRSIITLVVIDGNLIPQLGRMWAVPLSHQLPEADRIVASGDLNAVESLIRELGFSKAVIYLEEGAITELLKGLGL